MSSIIASSISEELKNYNGEWKPVGFFMPENFDISITLFQSLYLKKHSLVSKENLFLHKQFKTISLSQPLWLNPAIQETNLKKCFLKT